MAGLNSVTFAGQTTGHVQEAAEISSQQSVRAGGGDIGHFIADHAGRNFRIFNAERAAEAAAHIGVRQLLQLQTPDARQQPARLFLHTELAQAGTGIMIGDTAVKLRRHRLHAQLIGEKRHQLERFGGERLGARTPGGIVREECGIMMFDHAGAGAGRRHHGVEIFESFNHLAGDGCGIAAVARIMRRLAATGLRTRRFDHAAGILEQLDRGEADAGAKQINQAGDEQANPEGAALRLLTHFLAFLPCERREIS